MGYTNCNSEVRSRHETDKSTNRLWEYRYLTRKLSYRIRIVAELAGVTISGTTLNTVTGADGTVLAFRVESSALAVPRGSAPWLVPVMRR